MEKTINRTERLKKMICLIGIHNWKYSRSFFYKEDGDTRYCRWCHTKSLFVNDEPASGWGTPGYWEPIND